VLYSMVDAVSTSKTWSLGSVQDPALRGSELNGFAGKDCRLLWRFQVSGVRCQEKNIEAETCWSEAAAGNTEH
jgi:hypothetical protein